jgi:hypothetical protein
MELTLLVFGDLLYADFDYMAISQYYPLRYSFSKLDNTQILHDKQLTDSTK